MRDKELIFGTWRAFYKIRITGSYWKIATVLNIATWLGLEIDHYICGTLNKGERPQQHLEGFERGIEAAANELETGGILLPIVCGETKHDYGIRLLSKFAEHLRYKYIKET